MRKKKRSYLWCIQSYNTNNACSGVCMVCNSQNPNHSILRDKCRVILIIVRETKNKKLSERERERERDICFFENTKTTSFLFSHNTILWIPPLSLSLKHTKPKKEKKVKNQKRKSINQIKHTVHSLHALRSIFLFLFF